MSWSTSSSTTTARFLGVATAKSADLAAVWLTEVSDIASAVVVSALSCLANFSVVCFFLIGALHLIRLL